MKLAILLLALCLGTAPTAARAGTTVEVARVKLVLAEDGWESLVVKLGDVKLDSARGSTSLGMFGGLEAHAKVLTLRDAERQPLAVMLVYATFGAARNLRLSGDCPPDGRLYVRDFTRGRIESPECVLIGGRLDGKRFVQQSGSRLAEAWRLAPFDVPDQAMLLHGNFANSTGAVIVVEALISPHLKGLDGAQPGAAVPEGLPEPIAAWADAFGEAARKALRSFSGELSMPPVDFY